MDSSALRRLFIFAKAPAPGRVKTRLGRDIGARAATELAWALLEDTLALAEAAAARAGADLVVAHAPDRPPPDLRRRVAAAAPTAALEPQGAGDLGERLARVLGRARGRARVALGMDAPDVPAGSIVAAFRLLTEVPAVTGPAPDGGYYLLGLGPDAPESVLARGIRWSAPETLADTEAALRRAGAPVARLEARRDVDVLDDLVALRDRLVARGPDAAPRTRAWLAAHGEALEAPNPRQEPPSGAGLP